MQKSIRKKKENEGQQQALNYLAAKMLWGLLVTDYLLSFDEKDKGSMVEQFSDEEAALLGDNVTNLDSNIFAWRISDDFTPEQAGALLSRYSRTALTSRRLYLKEFYPNKSRGREFFDAWLVDYGDDSIQEMVGGLPVSCEYISNLAVKEVEDCRLGSYIEKSTRYVSFDKKLPNNQYMFYKDPEILSSKYADRYLSLMNGLFDSYSGNMERMMKYISDTNRIDDIGFRIGSKVVKITEFTKELEDESGITEQDLRKSYENSIKANALDFLRDYLPMSTLTHVGCSMDARAYENMLNKMLSSPLSESRYIASRLSSELKKVVPSLVKRVHDQHGNAMQSLYKERNDATYKIALELSKDALSNKEFVALSDYTGEGSANPEEAMQIRLSSIILYKFSRGMSLLQAVEKAKQIGEIERKKIIAAYVGKRTNRRHKPGRAFENVNYTFDLKGRIGIYRDIQRHRIGTQERQNFGVELGYETRQAYIDTGLDEDYNAKMAEVADLYKALLPTHPYQAQYCVTFGFNIRWYYTLNARQLYHLCELRSTHQGHPDYRKLVQDMAMKVKEVHPTIIEHMNYLDMSEKTVGRLDSEIRMAIKKSQISKG